MADPKDIEQIITDGFRQLNSRMDGFEQSIDARLGTFGKSIDARFSESDQFIDTRLNSFERSIQEQVDGLRETVQESAVNIDRILGIHTRLDDEYKPMIAQLDDHEGRITAIEGRPVEV